MAVLYRSNAQSRVIEHALFSAGLAVPRLRRACASSSAPRSSTRWPTCGCSRTPTTTARSCAWSTSRRAASVRARSRRCRTRRAPANLQPVRRGRGPVAAPPPASSPRSRAMIDRLRARDPCVPLPQMVEHVVERSGLVAHYQAEKEGQERLENLRELVNAAAAFLAEEGRRPGCAGRRSASARSRRRSRADAVLAAIRRSSIRPGRPMAARLCRPGHAAGGLPGARLARSRREPGRRGRRRGAADDDPCGQGPRVRCGLHHRPRRGPVPARERGDRAGTPDGVCRPGRAETASRRSAG